MSPATIIQTHTAYEGIDDKHPSVAGSDSSRFHHGAKSANDGFDAGKAMRGVDVRSPNKGAKTVPAPSIDDFGGRSDALGG
jgi:hypothetical protein